ncbi:MAG: ATP-dependent DNA helicase [Actinomycetota bacterium]
MTGKVSDAMRAALRDNDPSDEQWDVITADLEPVAIIAGAGSGKTAVMTARIIHLVEQNLVRPAEVLGLTFTNKAAGELEDRLSEALGAIVPRPHEHPTVMTYHAFAAKLVRDHGPRIGVDPEAGLLSDAQKWQLLLGLVDEFPAFDEVELRHPLSFIPQTLSLADGLANHLASADDLVKACEALLEIVSDNWSIVNTRKRCDFAKIIEKYQAKKSDLHRIDFGDQIRLAVDILERYEEVVTELRQRYPIVLLDEYQDTNPAQKVMLQKLCPQGSGVTAVGDARQTIYTWRGASMFNLISFNQEFRNEDGTPSRQASLSQNFRSGARIVALANRVIEKVPPERRPGSGLVSVPANGDGWVGAALFSDQEAEAVFVADEVDRLHNEGREWRDIAILVRKKRYMDRIVAALDTRDIPVEMPELGGLLRIPAVVDTIAWLQVLSDTGPATNRWAARILMGPLYRIHYGDLAPIARRAVDRNYELIKDAAKTMGIEEPDPGEVAYSLVESLAEADTIEGVSDEARTRIREFLALVDELRPSVSEGLQELVQTVIDRTGIGDALMASTSRTSAAMRENLNGFVGVCAEFAPLEGNASLSTFLDFLDVAETSEDPIPLASTASTDSVKLMTVHGAKGLEFDTVFLPVLAASQEVNRYDGDRKGSVFPDVRASSPMSSTTELPPAVRRDRDYLPVYKGNKSKYRTELKKRAEEDERRLFYVAITRAKQRLYCTAAHWYGVDEKKGPSIFLSEVCGEIGIVEMIRRDEPADENPVLEAMRRDLVWPPQQARVDDDVMDWIARVEEIRSGLASVDAVLAEPEARTLYAEHLGTIEALRRQDRPAEPPSRRRALAATAAVKAASGEAGVDIVMNPLPQRPTEAQRLGIEVHSWIEELHRGLIGLAEEDALDEASLSPDRKTVAALQANFKSMGFEDRRPFELPGGEPATEVPFTLKLHGDVIVRGRIDAVYQLADGSLEIVDFKTGAVPELSETDWDQLKIYAEALAALGYVKGEVTLTFAFLKTGEPRSERYAPRGLSWLEDGLETLAGAR